MNGVLSASGLTLAAWYQTKWPSIRQAIFFLNGVRLPAARSKLRFKALSVLKTLRRGFPVACHFFASCTRAV